MVQAADDEQWRGERAERWLRQAAGLERQLAPVSEVLFAAAQLREGERVLDVGCGTGPTTHAAAGLVGPAGGVCGLDVSGEMLAAAASVPTAPAAAAIEWVEADPVTWSGVGRRFDVVISRFGVMFFSDPPAAFATLARVTRSGGRLAVAVWRRRDESPLFAVPLHAAVEGLRTLGIDRTADGRALDDFLADDAGGPFSLHDPVATTALLEGAGWTDVATESHVLPLPFVGGMAPGAAARAALDFGPTRLLMAGQDERATTEVERAIGAALQAHAGESGQVVLDGAVRVLTAIRS